MAESTRYGLGDLVDIEQILVEAQHRWLRAAEICEIIRNYKKFRIAPQPAYMPASGSLFLFDRKVLRYFRKDDHNWRKKNDGTTVKEAHERLKVGSIDVLHCYYAYGEENEKFQRRSYWMLEEDLSHIALVHYREVKTSEGKWPLDRDVHMESEQDVNRVNVLYCLELCSAHTDKQENFPMQDNLQGQLSNAEQGYNLDLGKTNINFARKPLLDGPLTEEGLKKPDNFNRWMSKELGDINESHMQSSSGAYWDRVEDIFSQVDLDDYTLGPSVSQDQLFSIIKVLPIWAYEGSEIKVLITGSFLKNQQEAENYAWSCMFGELEVPAEVIADGVLRCYTPIHKAARVPFYVTRSNRLACSEVREFEFRVQHFKDMDITDNYSGNSRKILQMRFGKLLCQSSVCPPNSDYISLSEESLLNNKISSLLKEDGDEWHQMLKLASEKGYSPEKVKEKLLEKLLKEKFHVWLPQKAAEGGKGPSVLDKGGHGVLHFAAALGYNWVLKPTILAGVSVNFRDVNGWTALHWAAFCGREHAVAYLGFLGAALDVVTDPSPKYPSGRTPADLASANGHKQIAGDLAESALIAHLSSLKLDTQVPKDLTPHATRVMRETHHDPSLGSLPFGGLITDNPMAVNLPISPGENRVKPLAPFNSKTIQRSATQVAQQQAGPAADAQPADPEAASSSQLRLQVSQLQLEVSQLRLVVSQVASAFATEQRRLTEDRRQADRIKTEISDLRAGLLTGVASVGGAGEDFEDALDAFLRGGGGDST